MKNISHAHFFLCVAKSFVSCWSFWVRCFAAGLSQNGKFQMRQIRCRDTCALCSWSQTQQNPGETVREAETRRLLHAGTASLKPKEPHRCPPEVTPRWDWYYYLTGIFNSTLFLSTLNSWYLKHVGHVFGMLIGSLLIKCQTVSLGVLKTLPRSDWKSY